MEELLQQILQECRPYTGQGALASYIPELARQDPDRLGIAVFHKDGTLVEAGDSRRSFTIQSVMKPLSLLLALQDNGRETVRAHVGVEATGKPFDAINVADNALLAKHLNPMVNAGAILMCQLIGGETYDHRFQRLLDFIRRLADGYDTVIAEDGGNISQGQKQLLCIARVMLCLPPMLILDEATSSIDTRTEVRIQAAFARMMQGRTSFIVAHRLSTIREADVILVMKDGHIVEQGNHDELLAQGGFYAKLYNSQFEGVET